MELYITTLSENTDGMGDFLAEWGLSILVETDEATVLLDTGKSISASHSAHTLGIDLRRIDKIVLSHGHFDHTGGLRQILFKMRKEVEIIAHPHVWGAKYHRRQGRRDRHVGIPFLRQELESLGAHFNMFTKPLRITDSIMTTGEIPMVISFEEINANLFIKEDADWQPDKLLDDLALIINTEFGLVVVVGCAHRGIINTLYHAQRLTGVDKIHAVLGGSHLIDTSEEWLRLTIAALKELDIQKLGLCHCTSLPAASLLAQEFGDRFFFNNAGTKLSSL